MTCQRCRLRPPRTSWSNLWEPTAWHVTPSGLATSPMRPTRRTPRPRSRSRNTGRCRDRRHRAGRADRPTPSAVPAGAPSRQDRRRLPGRVPARAGTRGRSLDHRAFSGSVGKGLWSRPSVGGGGPGKCPGGRTPGGLPDGQPREHRGVCGCTYVSVSRASDRTGRWPSLRNRWRPGESRDTACCYSLLPVTEIPLIT